jgi:hypothetical protein
MNLKKILATGAIAVTLATTMLAKTDISTYFTNTPYEQRQEERDNTPETNVYYMFEPAILTDRKDYARNLKNANKDEPEGDSLYHVNQL